uniref:Growth-regulated protein homolog gamma-like n=1 Tax=Petromyzon marinus TaxID=7757 RepID=A0AAJ7SIG8_PETMA|nr:growth-regulated protein homolog gamma-like [Petromyzon marinus]
MGKSLPRVMVVVMVVAMTVAMMATEGMAGHVAAPPPTCPCQLGSPRGHAAVPSRFNLSKIRRARVTCPSAGCPLQIVATLQTLQTVCLDPLSPRIQRLVRSRKNLPACAIRAMTSSRS